MQGHVEGRDQGKITSSKLADDKDGNEDEDEGDDEDEETGAPAETFVERIKRDIRVSRLAGQFRVHEGLQGRIVKVFLLLLACTEEAKEAAAAATAADKDEIDEVTVTLDTESAAERAAEVCEASGNCDPSSTEVQEAFNEVLPGDVIDTEIPEGKDECPAASSSAHGAHCASEEEDRRVQECEEADLLKCIKEEASDKVLLKE